MKALSLYNYSRSTRPFLALTRTRTIAFGFDAKIATQRRFLSSDMTTSSSKKPTKSSDSTKTNTTATLSQDTAVQGHDHGKKKVKTMAEMDEELRLKLEGISGEGGEAGLELEDGKPVAMKRGVKENMFRLI